MPRKTSLIPLILTAILLAITPAALPWGAPVHRIVTYAALKALPEDAPDWLTNPHAQHRIAFQSNQVDRWRGWPAIPLQHENDPNHFIDIELLKPYGLSLQTLPKLRREYLRKMVIATHENPDHFKPYDDSKDPARRYEWPGFLPYEIAEQYAKLQAAFHQVRILEQLREPQRNLQLEQARAIAIYHAGILAHFVADAAQPLHTTKHYDGWKGQNPAEYKWRDRFHAYVDDQWAETHNITLNTIAANLKPHQIKQPRDPWNEIRDHIQRSFDHVPRLYELERDGKLDDKPGATLLRQRLRDAAAMLAGLIQAACNSAEPTPDQVKSWTHYNAFDPARLPNLDNTSAAPAKPANKPPNQTAP